MSLLTNILLSKCHLLKLVNEDELFEIAYLKRQINIYYDLVIEMIFSGKLISLFFINHNITIHNIHRNENNFLKRKSNDFLIKFNPKIESNCHITLVKQLLLIKLSMTLFCFQTN